MPDTYEFTTLFDGTERPTEYGSVSIHYEKGNPGGRNELHRPIYAAGFICLPGGTTGRKSAPEPASGFRVGMTKNMPKKALAISGRNNPAFNVSLDTFCFIP